MEIVLENTSDVKNSIIPSSTINSRFGTLPDTTLRLYRTGLPMDGSTSTTPTDYYGTLPPRGRNNVHHVAHSQPDFDITTSVRRVDKSGLLEIIELEPGRSPRPRHLTGAENPCHAGTLTRRVDRTGRLEAVPEVPDQLQVQRSPEINVTKPIEIGGRSITERHLTGAEINNKDQTLQTNKSLSPRANKLFTETLTKVDENCVLTPSNIHGVQTSSPYSRRNKYSPQPTTIMDKLLPVQMNLSPNLKFSTITTTTSTTSITASTTTMSLDSRIRQPYVDLTGATYTRACSNSPIMISSRPTSGSHDIIPISGDTNDTLRDRKPPTPDCLARLSPRSRGQSPLTVSSIPDVIEAHGSRTTTALNTELDKDIAPKGQRAEAEGCEHTAIQTLEETRVPFKASNKLLHNDNIQTLRVIILSEQL